MREQPVIEGGIIILAPLTPEDAERVHLLAGDPAIAETAMRIPHPLPRSSAEEWITDCIRGWEEDRCAVWKILLPGSHMLIGAVGLTIDTIHNHAELGYWVGREYWGNGYARAAVKEVIRFAVEIIGIHRIHATCLPYNTASIRVLNETGFVYEGCMHEHVFHQGDYRDLLLFGIVPYPSKRDE